MRMHTKWMPLSLVTGLAIVGCGSEGGDGGGGDDDGSSTTNPEPAVIIDIAVDTNRDGVVNPADATDQDAEDAPWSPTLGASFIANLDDDNLNGLRDVEDGADALGAVMEPTDPDVPDLARIVVQPWAKVPKGAFGVLRLVDGVSAEHVRVWVESPGDKKWYLVGGSVGPCGEGQPCQFITELRFPDYEVAAGIQLGIEGRGFVMAPGGWNGVVQLEWHVEQGPEWIPNDKGEYGDTAKMRLAPWLLFGNLSPFGVAGTDPQVSSRVWTSADDNEFVDDVKVGTDDLGVIYQTYNNWGDQWTQDFFQTGWTAFPAPNGGVQGMRIANARPWGRSAAPKDLPIEWLKKNYLGPGHGLLETYKKAPSGDSYDSHGNHDLIPPYGDWPLGRIFHGSGVIPETKAFYAAQPTQGPPFTVKTSWLTVGHVDETLSYAPSATERGWKLLVADTKVMTDILEAESAGGNGGVIMFAGKQGYINDQLAPFQRTIDEALADTELAAWSQESQAEIDDQLAALVAEIGLTPDEIIKLPTWFEEVYGQKVAWNPGTVNMLVMGNNMMIPKPFSAQIGGQDILEKFHDEELCSPKNQLGKEGNGMKCFYTNNWYTYHILLGETHCGSNPEAPPPYSDITWWSTGK